MTKILHKKRLYNFIDKITVSKKRRPKYFKLSDKIPKKYSTNDFVFNSKGLLINKKTSEKVIKNPIAAGTPKILKISGQDIWRGIPFHTRSMIAKELKLFFYDNFVNEMPLLKITDYPIGVEMIFYDIVTGEDLNNQEYFYKKCLGDAMCGNVSFTKTKIGKKISYIPDYDKYPKKINDDSKEFIQEYITKFVPIEKHEERSLEIIIYKL